MRGPSWSLSQSTTPKEWKVSFQSLLRKDHSEQGGSRVDVGE